MGERSIRQIFRRNHRIRVLLLATLAALALAACAEPSAAPQATETRLSGIVTESGGQLTLAGEVIDLSGAAVTVDGAAAAAAAVLPGVEIEGTAAAQRAGRTVLRSVDVRYRVRGALDAVDVEVGSLDVAGVRAFVDAWTVIVEEREDGWEPLTFADLTPGDILRIAGVPLEDDSILATRIERQIDDDPERVELRLRVRGLDETAMTFGYGLGTHTVDYGATEVRGELSEGVFVRVRGELDGTAVRAERVVVRERDDDAPRSGARIKITGPVEGLDEAAQAFTVLGFAVDYGGARIVGPLRDGAYVHVRGSVAVAGEAVTAERVVVHRRGGGHGFFDGKVEGVVDAVDPVAMTLSVAGLELWADEGTAIEREGWEHDLMAGRDDDHGDDDHGDDDDEDIYVDFADITVGEWAEVRYDTTRSDDASRPYAVKIELEDMPGDDDGPGGDPSGEVEIEGVIGVFDGAARTFAVGSTTVTVSVATEYELRRGGSDDSDDEVDVTADAFWSADRSGAGVKVEGSYQDDGSLLAREIEADAP